MTWLAIKLFLGGALKRLWEALGSVFRTVLAYPWQAACLALLLAFVWQTRGKSNALDKLAAQEMAHAAYVEQVEAASAANKAAAIAQVEAVEAQSAELAEDAQHVYELAIQDARAATARFAAANRVRPGKGDSCPAPAAPEGNDPGVPADLPPDPSLVAIRETELQQLVKWSTVGIEAHNHAVDKINGGLAKVPEGWPEPAF